MSMCKRCVRFFVVLLSAMLLCSACSGGAKKTNHPPIASAGADQNPTLAQTATLDGSGSLDPDGDEITFLWEIAEAPEGSNAVLLNNTSSVTHFTPDLLGTWTIRLTVFDGKLTSEPDVVQVTAKCGNDVQCDHCFRCNGSGDCVLQTPGSDAKSECTDGLFCNGSETCDGTGGCQSGTNPCGARECDEDNNTCLGCQTDTDCPKCQTCNTENGHCENEPQEVDIKDECPAGDCVTGSCSGNGDCELLSSGTPCTDTESGDCLDAQCDQSGQCLQDFALETDLYVCRAAQAECEQNAFCDGANAVCPSNLFRTDGETCAGGACCTGACCLGPNHCCTGVCQACCANSDCDDQNPCTSDLCNGGSCSHTSLAAGIQCAGSSLVNCDGNGTTTQMVDCDLGCNSAENPNRCTQIVTSNLNNLSYLCDLNSTDLVLQPRQFLLFHTNTGTATVGATTIPTISYDVPQGGGAPNIRVYVFRNLSIPATAMVSADGTRALALFACNDVTISGQLDISGTSGSITGNPVNRVYGRGGPGGFNGGYDNGTANGTNGWGTGGGRGGVELSCAGFGVRADSGGAGGSFGGPGGAGGNGFINASCNPAGGASLATYGLDTLIPLWGGSGGGEGGNSTGGPGGGGGGALQISANGTITIEASGGILAVGGGGGGGHEGADASAGGGGGSGGGVLLEAPAIVIRGKLSANGGGGGAAFPKNTNNALSAPSGSAGTLTQTAAPGGNNNNDTDCLNALPACLGGIGGNGGINATAALPGENKENGGGGGGGAGRIRLNTQSGTATMEGTGFTSPPAFQGTITTR
jgi:hypothetical protein